MQSNKGYFRKKTYGDGAIHYYDENHCLHRIGGPAIENKDGYKCYLKHGKTHNLEGPARTWSNGRKEYWIEGKYFSSKEEWEKKVAEIKKNEGNNPSAPASKCAKTTSVKATKATKTATKKSKVKTMSKRYFRNVNPDNIVGLFQCPECGWTTEQSMEELAEVGPPCLCEACPNDTKNFELVSVRVTIESKD